MAQFVELDIDQGTTFNFNLDLTEDDGSPKNITNYTITSSISKSYYSTTPTANLIVQIPSAANGNVTLTLSASTTSNIKAGRYLFDIKQVTPANVTSRIVEGIITVNPQITK